MTDGGKYPHRLAIIGMGANGLESLVMPAVRELFAADDIFTSRRLAGLLPEDLRGKCRFWPRPFAVPFGEIEALRAQGRRVAALLTGNPFFFGAGSLIARRIPARELVVFPSPSSCSLAAARMGWAMQNVQFLSLHGRRAALMQTAIHPGARIFVVGHDGGTPLEAATILSERGFGESPMAVLANMGTPEEARFDMLAREIVASGRRDFPPFHILAIRAVAGGNARILPLAPGLPDALFEHDGQLTKQTVRAVTVSALAPWPRARLWDIGAGCGGVCVEWLRLAGPLARAFAVERDARRCAMIRRNADRLGAAGMEIHNGEAPAALADLPAPDAVFIGGSVQDDALFETAFNALRPGGTLVINAVTAGGEATLLRRHETHGGELLRLAVSRAEPLGGLRAMRPALPVTQLRLKKEGGS